MLWHLLWVLPCLFIVGLIVYKTVYSLWRQWQVDQDERARYQAETKTIIQGQRFRQWKPDEHGFLGIAIDQETGDLVNLDLTLETGNPQALSVNERQRLLASLNGTSLKTVQEIIGQNTPALPETFTAHINPSIERKQETIDL